MADLDRFLRRFRRLVSPPGRPRPAGVPSDRKDRLSGELAEVFSAIDAVGQEAEAIRKEGRGKADAVRSKSEEEADAIASKGQEDAEGVRVEEAAKHRGTLQEEMERTRAQGQRDADAVRARANERIGALSDRLIAKLLHEDGKAGG